MSQLPIPSFATLERLSGWVSEQSTVFVKVIENPQRFYAEKVSDSPDPIPEALKFFAFMLLVCFVIVVPIYVIFFKVDVLEVKIAISAIMPFLFAVVLFSSLIFLFGKLLRGDGTFRLTLAGMLYFSALMPFLYLPDYIILTDPDARAAILAGDMTSGKAAALVPTIGALLALAVITYVIVRLFPLVKTIHKVGFIRAAIIISLTGSVYGLYEVYVWRPLLADLVRNAAGS